MFLLMSHLEGLKICFLAGTLGQGGAERQLYYQLQALLRVKALPFVIAFSRNEYWEEPIKALGVPVFALPAESRRFIRLQFAAGVIRRERPAIIQATHFYVNLYACLACVRLALCVAMAFRTFQGRAGCLDGLACCFQKY
jgi:hypothetical protein